MRRGRTVALLLLGAGLALASVTQDWVRATVVGAGDVAVSGSTAAGVVTALAWVAAAGAVAMTLARPRAGRALALVVLVAAAGSAAAVVSVLTDPAAALRPAVSAATGTTTAPLSGVATTPWPLLALVAAVTVAVAAASALVSAGRWAAPADRYEAATSSTADTRDAWQALDRGEDPTGSDPAGSGAVDQGRGDLPQ